MNDRSSPEITLQRQGPPIIRPSFLFSLIVGIAAVVLVALFAVDSYFVADRQSAILSAQGKAEGIRLEGESRAAVLRMNAEILKTSPLVIDLAKADRWNGALPLTLLEGTGSVPLLSLPPGEVSEKR